MVEMGNDRDPFDPRTAVAVAAEAAITALLFECVCVASMAVEDDAGEPHREVKG